MARPVVRLRMAVDAFLTQFPTVPEGQSLQLFLLLADGPQEGLLMTDLQTSLGLTSSAISRQIGLLGETGYRNGAQGEVSGVGLLDAFVDPMDRRRRIIRLTPKGRRVADRIAKLMET